MMLTLRGRWKIEPAASGLSSDMNMALKEALLV